MQHLHPQQHGSSNSAHRSASEIEAFRARQRMQLRYHQQQQQQQQHLQSLHTGNQAEEHLSSIQERVSNEDDDRVRKVTLSKRCQQLQQRLQHHHHHHHHQQQTASNRQATKLPNFGVDCRHHQQHHQYQHQQQYMFEDEMPSPVPLEAHTMFNAFDYGNSPEAFMFAEQQQDDNNNNGGDGNQQMQQHDDDDNAEKSIWGRRFAADDAHLRRLPKLGQDALWDSPSSVSNNNQFSHHQHPYQTSSHPFYQQ